MKWVKLTSARNEIEAGMICGLLEGEGILTTRKYKGPNQYLSIVMGPVVELDIWVPEDRLEESAGILKTFLNV